jgi:hypothetical protein
LASEKATDKLADGYALKIAKVFLVLKHADPVNTHQIFADFNGLKVNRVGKSEQTVALNEPSARSPHSNLVPLPYNSASEVTSIASAIHP